MNRSRLFSLQYKVFGLSFGLIILTAVLLGIVFSRSFHKHYLEKMEESLKAQAVLTSHVLLPDFVTMSEAKFAEKVKLLQQDLPARITIIDNRGSIVGDTNSDKSAMDNHAGRPEVKAALKGNIGSSMRFSKTTGTRSIYVAVPIEKQGTVIGVVRASMSLGVIERLNRKVYYTLGSGLITFLLLASMLGFLFSWKIVKPINDMGKAALQMSNGDFGVRVAVHGDGEVAALARSLNRMGQTVFRSIEQLKAEKRKIEVILSNLADGILVTDMEGSIILANQSAEKMFGVVARDIIGQPVIKALINHEIDESVLRAFTLNRTTEIEVKLEHPVERILHVYSVPLNDAEGHVNGTLVVFQDVSKLKRLEQIRQDFVANVSHELRTPIASIKAMAETLLDGALKDADVSWKFLSTINSESDRLARLVDDLLNLSRIESKNAPMTKGVFTLAQLIDDTVLQLRSKAADAGVTLETSVDGAVPIFADRDRIQQIFVNLLDNAIAYAGKGSCVVVGARNRGSDHVEFWVEDDGVGIPNKDLDRIFERFYRVDKARSRQLGSTGLGLSIVKHIVEAHGGTIKVESEEGMGSKFLVQLPMSKEMTV